MRITWVTRSFLDYRLPVFAALDELINHQLYILFSSDYVPERVFSKIKCLLGSRAIGLPGEWQLGYKGSDGMANIKTSIQFHPRLLKVIKACQPDVLVGDGFFKWTVAALLYKLMRGVPIVVCYERTFHTERDAQWFRTAYRRAAIRLLDAMCCNGKLCVDYTQWLGMPVERITTGYTVADTKGLQQKLEVIGNEERECLRRKLGVRGVVFLYVGRLIKLKGVHYLLEAWARFEETKPGAATLLIVGDGPEGTRLRHLSARLKLEAVRFVGSVYYDEIVRFYAAADVFIIPTVEDNWSLVVPEAMACELPILCSKYNGCWPELVHSGENGWVFDPLDRKDILQCLELCMKNRDRLPQMGERSKVIVSDRTPIKAAESILRACKIATARR